MRFILSLLMLFSVMHDAAGFDFDYQKYADYPFAYNESYSDSYPLSDGVLILTQDRNRYRIYDFDRNKQLRWQSPQWLVDSPVLLYSFRQKTRLNSCFSWLPVGESGAGAFLVSLGNMEDWKEILWRNEQGKINNHSRLKRVNHTSIWLHQAWLSSAQRLVLAQFAKHGSCMGGFNNQPARHVFGEYPADPIVDWQHEFNDLPATLDVARQQRIELALQRAFPADWALSQTDLLRVATWFNAQLLAAEALEVLNEALRREPQNAAVLRLRAQVADTLWRTEQKSYQKKLWRPDVQSSEDWRQLCHLHLEGQARPVTGSEIQRALKVDELNPEVCRSRVVLHQAIEQGEIATVMQVLEQGADPNQYDTEGRSPLLLAIQSRQLSLVEALLKFGANPNENSSYLRQSAARLAYQLSTPNDGERFDAQLLNLLFAQGLDVNAIVKYGDTAWQYYNGFNSKKPGYVALLQWLLEHGAVALPKKNCLQDSVCH